MRKIFVCLLFVSLYVSSASAIDILLRQNDDVKAIIIQYSAEGETPYYIDPWNYQTFPNGVPDVIVWKSDDQAWDLGAGSHFYTYDGGFTTKDHGTIDYFSAGMLTYDNKYWSAMDSGERAVIQIALENSDWDDDGVSDWQEIIDETSPLEPGDVPLTSRLGDSDGDGVPDWVEVLAGTDWQDAFDYPLDEDYDGWVDIFDLNDNDSSVHPVWDRYPDDFPPDGGDFDNDGILNEVDDDWDGDGISNWDEIYWGSDPLDPYSVLADTDGDGFSDIWEQQVGTGWTNEDSHPLNPDTVEWITWVGPAEKYYDSDGDGISDFLEHYYGTDPGNSGSTPTDTDGDGWPDLAEIEFGSDPNNAASHPPYGFGYVSPISEGGIGGEIYTDPWLPDPNWVKPPPFVPDPPDPGPDPTTDIYTGDPDPVDERPEGPEVTDDNLGSGSGSTATLLTRDDMAIAVQLGIASSQGSIADAVEAGVYAGMENLSDEIALGLEKSLSGMEDAFGKALEKVGSNVGDGPSSGGLNLTGLSSKGSGISSLMGALPGSGAVAALKPSSQSSFEFDVTLPGSFNPGSGAIDIFAGGDYDYTLSTSPDISTAVGQKVNTLRLFFRGVFLLIFVWIFGRHVVKIFYKIT